MSNVENDTPELAEYYDRVSDSQFELGLILTDLMKIKAGDVVLDVGCGTGRLAQHVSGLAGPAGKVIGIDPSPHRIRVARERLQASGADNVRFTIGDAEALAGFQDVTFDSLYYCAVFHWIGDKQAALSEAYRVLKPGGTVGITSRNRTGPSLRRKLIHEWLETHPEALEAYARRPDRARARWASREELDALLKQAGFGDIRFETRERTVCFQSPEDYLAFLKASSFGQMSRIPEGAWQKVADHVAAELEKRRTPRGIELQTSSLFALATKKA